MKTIQIKREGRRWMLVLSCDDVPINPLPATGRQAGIDVGSSVSPPPATGHTSTIPAGDAPRRTGWPARSSGYSKPSGDRRTGTASARPSLRGIARSLTGARIFTTNKPASSSHGTTFWWWRIYRSSTCCGGLNPSLIPTIPGSSSRTGPAAKTEASRSISDAGWGRFVSILRAKAEEAGRIWIEVDPRHTSDRCEACGHAAPENRVTQAAIRLPAMPSSTAQADEHAARNLLRAGLALHPQAA